MNLSKKPLTAILILAVLVIPFILGGCGADLSPPEVVETDPEDGATAVPVGKTITVTFDKEVEPDEAWDNITVKIVATGQVIEVTKTLDGAVLTLDPVNDFAPDTQYGVLLPESCVRTKYTGRRPKMAKCVKPEGQPFEEDYNFSFTTEGGSQVDPPTVTGTDPAEGATGVSSDKTVKITFNKEIEAGSAWGNIQLKQGTSPVPVNVSIDSQNAAILVIDPIDSLAPSASFSVIVPAGAVQDKETHTAPLAEQFTLNFSTGGAPTVTATDPQDGSTNVHWDKTITVTFSENVLEGAAYTNITLMKGSTPAPFTKTLSGNVLTIDPDSPLEKYVLYTVTVPAGAVNNASGFPLGSDCVINFRTSDPPTLVSTDPADNQINVPVDKTVTVKFSKDIAQGSNWADISLKAGDTVIAATNTISGDTLSLNPDSDLSQDTNYTVLVPAGAVKSVDQPGVPGDESTSDVSFGFLTGYPPAVTSSNPASGAVNVPINTIITVTYDENILPGDAFANITLTAPGPVVAPATVTNQNNVLTITPASSLQVNTTYTVTIPADAIKDAAGNVTEAPYSFNFTTDDTVFYENFNGGIPDSWTIVDGGNDGLTWMTVDPGLYNIGAPFTDPAGIVDSNQGGLAYMDEQLISPSFDCSYVTGAIKMQFANCFTYYAYGPQEIGNVDVSVDGGQNWTNVLSMSNDNFGPELRVIDITNEARGYSNVKVRFHYYNARNDYWWLVDDVKIYEQ